MWHLQWGLAAIVLPSGINFGLQPQYKICIHNLDWQWKGHGTGLIAAKIIIPNDRVIDNK